MRTSSLKKLSTYQPLIAVICGLALGLLVVAATGENPFHVLAVLGRSAFASRYDLGMTLFYSTPLILTGLSVSVAFRAGMFNIGAEGQLLMGALGATLCGIYFPTITWPWAPLCATLGAAVFGASWGAFAGILKVKRGSHEVITTIMLNFIAAALTSWFILYPLKSHQSQNPESLSVAPAYLLKKFAFFQEAPVTSAILAALTLVFLVRWMYQKSSLGFELKCVGESPQAAHSAGINPEHVRVIAFSIAGAFAGLVGAVEILGNSEKFKMDFSPGYGFTGIAVALLARGNPVGILFSALLFGALHKGSLDLDIETEKITREVSMVIQGLIILTVAADGLWQWMKDRDDRSVQQGVR